MKIFLTKAETDLFIALADSLVSGVTVEAETLSFEDSGKRMAIRVRNMHLAHPMFAAWKEKATAATTTKQMADLLSAADLSVLSDDDLTELYFAMGPAVIGDLVNKLLPNVRSTEDLEALASLSLIRHSLLLSLSTVPLSL